MACTCSSDDGHDPANCDLYCARCTKPVPAKSVWTWNGVTYCSLFCCREAADAR